MGVLIQFATQLTLGALLLLLSIKIVDGYNPKNTFGAALGWSLAFAAAGLFPLLGLILVLVVFFMVCTRYYELGIFQSIGVLLVQFGLAIGLSVALAALGVAA